MASTQGQNGQVGRGRAGRGRAAGVTRVAQVMRGVAVATLCGVAAGAVSVVMVAGHEARAAELTGREIADKALKNNTLGLDEAAAKVKMVIKRKNSADRVRVIQSKAKKSKEGLSRNYIYFEEPPDVRGTAFLNLEVKGGDTSQMLYLPAAKKTRRIASNNKDGSFMGTDFSYKDMEVRDIDEGNYTRLADETLGGVQCWVIEVTPKDPSDQVYSKNKMWIDKGREVPLKIEFFDKKGALQKTLVVRKYKQIDDTKAKKKRWVATESVMTDNQKGGSTELFVETVSFDEVVPEDVFTEQFLSRG